MYECISGGGLAGSGGGDAAADAGLLSQGVAMRDALAADLQQLDDVAVSCVASRQAPLSAALAGVRRIDADAEANARPAPAADFLAREALLHDHVWVIAPESDDLLATLAVAVGPERWVGCTPPAIRLAASKAATRRRLGAAGIAVPAAWSPGEPEPAAGAHWIVKPDDGAGSVDAHLHADFAQARDDLLARLARGVASTLEEWIDGTPLSLSLLCRDGRAELVSINRQRIVARAGAPVVYEGVDIRSTPVDGPLGRLLAGVARRVAAAVPGLAGFVGVDLVWRGPAAPGAPDDRRGPIVIEINPRVTCAYVGLSAALGRNLAGEILFARHTEPAINGLH